MTVITPFLARSSSASFGAIRMAEQHHRERLFNGKTSTDGNTDVPPPTTIPNLGPLHVRGNAWSALEIRKGILITDSSH